MKNTNLKLVLVAFLSATILFSSCSQDDDSGDCSDIGPLEGLTIRFTPDAGTSSVEYFQYTFNEDYTVSGSLNNETQYYGATWEYLECPSILLSYPDGGNENITFTSDTRYSYTGVTSTGYSESHIGTWSSNETTNPIDIEYGSYTDLRDNTIYKTIIIGNQEWMAENLKYAPSTGNYWAYDNNASNVETYGYLYDAETASLIAPQGWHLPSDTEWETLKNYINNDGHMETEGTALKATSGWGGDGNGTDVYGFSALPGGFRNGLGNFLDMGSKGLWWGSTKYPLYDDFLFGYHQLIYYGYDFPSSTTVNERGFSVRCLRD
jgi:uncharacterized protein (TIGR02145 family)